MGGELRRDGLGAVVHYLPDVLVGVEEMGQVVDDVGFEEFAQHCAELPSLNLWFLLSCGSGPLCAVA